MRTLYSMTLVVTFLSMVAASQAFAIEAVRGKQYSLTKQHGPWMIMAASFRDVPEERRQKGLSAQDAALELVYELREKGIPAYTYSQSGKVQKIETVDRMGREDDRIFAAQRDMICVIAGNYEAIDDDKAQKTLQYIKKFRPKFMTSEESGAIFRETPGRKGPLSGAFLTINPLLSPNELAHRKMDPDVVRLNNSSRFPLMGNKRKYTVQVATFAGRKTTPIGSSAYKGKESDFDASLKDPNSYGLGRAGEDAEQLTAALRARKIEAFVHHDRYQSIVTVGSFDTPNDPIAAKIRQEFGPKNKKDPKTGLESIQPETLIIPTGEKATDLPHVWVYDLNPMVVAVPHAK